MKLDREDEVLEVSVEGIPVSPPTEILDGSTRLTIPLTEPLKPGTTKRVQMTTKRELMPQASTRLTFNGFPISHAKEQSGAIGIAQGGNLFISGTAGRGLRQIDPRTELPPDLRARPLTILAYQFVDQPFGLSLRIDPSPPLVGSNASTTISIASGQAQVDTRFHLEVTHGRLFDLGVAFLVGAGSRGGRDPEHGRFMATGDRSGRLASADSPTVFQGAKGAEFDSTCRGAKWSIQRDP